MAQTSWKLEEAARQKAQRRGEEIAKAYGADSYPVDPFEVVRAERELIHAEGLDFGDAFDGRLSYVGPRFLLCYNTKYNAWTHNGEHHPKVRFTIGHELGHFFIDAHRSYLVKQGEPHGCQTEFDSDVQVERQADSFSVGLLMPKYLLGPLVNQEDEPSLEAIREAARAFDVSLTAMSVRWTQLSHFPCATICIREGRIAWGFLSEGFKEAGLYKAKRGSSVSGQSALAFLRDDPSVTRFRIGEGAGLAKNWIAWDGDRVPVSEHYMAIPYNSSVLVFICADEEDLLSRWED